MIVLEYKIKGKPAQYKAIDQAIGTTQFIRNKAIRYWRNAPREQKIDKFALNKYSTILRKKFPFFTYFLKKIKRLYSIVNQPKKY